MQKNLARIKFANYLDNIFDTWSLINAFYLKHIKKKLVI